MRLIDIASSEFVWRGMEYYKQNKVLCITYFLFGMYIWRYY